MLKQRVITAIILAALAITALFLSTDAVWQWIVLGLALLAGWEWAGFAQLIKVWQKAAYALVMGVVCYFALQLFTVENIVLFTLLESVLVFSVVSRYQRSQGMVGTRSVGSVLLLGLLSIVLFSVSLIHFRNEFSPEIVLMSFFVIWAIDTGAFFSGRRFGKTKLAIYVSPGKTWEGVWGGVLLAFVVSLLGLFLLGVGLKFNSGLFALMLTVIALFSVMGDLFESVLKRQVGLKDSGRILPGHGGVLDRVDSLLLAVPMLYLLWHFGSLV